ncbi:dihydrolipoyl dehydrogenase [Clostridium sp. D2Q-14]|uniref:YjcQ family protein n=1 Tax=Anaeromonas gelatinilytica TaxID=2683194 RepID=UPI00193B9BB4|nr:YjcQ family protein [Anaeromonas gelatinilytica]MBS4535826.1 dihydrolipoyl dehydrogenase [Anaeromonas gelatinilytica]
MDNFKIIYKILKMLEKYMDVEDFDKDLITHESLGISEIRWTRIIEMLVSEGYISGVRLIKANGQKVPLIRMTNISITLKGLEYLEENSLMKKAAELVKGIAGIVK